MKTVVNTANQQQRYYTTLTRFQEFHLKFLDFKSLNILHHVCTSNVMNHF